MIITNYANWFFSGLNLVYYSTLTNHSRNGTIWLCCPVQGLGSTGSRNLREAECNLSMRGQRPHVQMDRRLGLWGGRFFWGFHGIHGPVDHGDLWPSRNTQKHDFLGVVLCQNRDMPSDMHFRAEAMLLAMVNLWCWTIFLLTILPDLLWFHSVSL